MLGKVQVVNGGIGWGIELIMGVMVDAKKELKASAIHRGEERGLLSEETINEISLCTSEFLDLSSEDKCMVLFGLLSAENS